MRKVIWVLSTALLFTLIFYKQRLGLNLVIYEGILLSYLLSTRSPKTFTKNGITLLTAVVSTLVATLAIHSVFTYWMNILSLILFSGYLVYPEMKSLVSAFKNALFNIVLSPIRFFKELLNTSIERKNTRVKLKRIRIFILPLLVIILFVIIYSAANPVFHKFTEHISIFFNTYFGFLFDNLNIVVISLYIFGAFIGMYFLFAETNAEVVHSEINTTDNLARKRRQLSPAYSLMALKNEFRAGVFLLAALNLLLLFINIIDINWVWINFEWEGQFLKQFVHKGTYLLILSILISVAVVLYFFRGNINFYKKNKALKILSYIWIGQNAFLVLSVGLRNLYYIKNFALADKRIGVFIFLLLTLYGLYSVAMKVYKRKTGSHLLKQNFYICFCVLTLSSFVNWDRVIVQYNFNHAETAFLHYDYLQHKSDKTLPYLDRDLDELKKNVVLQQSKFAFIKEKTFMDATQYHNHIQERKKSFIENWEKTSLLSWNWAEQRAYTKLKAKKMKP